MPPVPRSSKGSGVGKGTGNVPKPNRQASKGHFIDPTFVLKNGSIVEAEKELAEMLVNDVKLSRNSVEGLNWQNLGSKPTVPKRSGAVPYQTLFCPYRFECECPYRCRLLHHSDGTRSVVTGTFVHCDAHQQTSRRKYCGGIPLAQREVIFSSPSKLTSMTRGKAVSLLNKKGYTVPKEDFRRIEAYVASTKQKAVTAHLPQGQSILTTGAVIATCEEYTEDRRRELLGNAFDEEHTVFVRGNPFLNQAHSVFYCVFSSNNLLLNAWRQSLWGQPVFISVDTSYRYTWEGYGLYPVCTVDISQRTHVIAYALIDSDSEEQEQIDHEVQDYDHADDSDFEDTISDSDSEEEEQSDDEAQDKIRNLLQNLIVPFDSLTLVDEVYASTGQPQNSISNDQENSNSNDQENINNVQENNQDHDLLAKGQESIAVEGEATVISTEKPSGFSQS